MPNLNAYFARVGLDARAQDGRSADRQFLGELVLAHTQSIAFENLDALMRVPVRLDLASLEAKLVHASRGGYCFEHNGYFAAVLEQLGFAVQHLAARVVWGGTAAVPWQNPRTHMALLVSVSGQQFLCDVGFGGITPTGPLRFEMGSEQPTPHETFRIVEHENLRLLQVLLGTQWLDVYLFDLQPQASIDYEMANHYVATHSASHFRYTLMAARAFAGGRYHLRNRVLTTLLPDSEKQRRELRDSQEQIQVLRDCFGIDVPDETAFEAALENIRAD